MDLTPTAAEAALRADVRAWLREHLPWEYGRGLPPRFDDLAEEVAFGREWQAKLASGRWVGVAWPEEYGGRGAGPVEHYIVTEELARARAPELVGRIGVNLVGPTLLAHGTPEQKARFLPNILSATEIWCQLFSEPGAGSDLTSLSTRAERVDGGWQLNGQKVWTSYAQFADWGWCLARTDPDAPKSKGISALVVDMHASGVEVRPLRQITDESDFNEVFFSDVFIPEDRLVGPEHGGWQVANSTLTHERGVNPRQLVIHAQLIDELWRFAIEQGAFDDPRLAPRLAQAFAEVRIFQLHNWRSISRTAKGADPGPVGSINKLWWSEMSKRLHDTVMAVVGDAAPLWRGASENAGDGVWQRSWLYYQASSIWAGTNEIQRNVIGERTLGLPREPRA
ncbi:MAG: Acyl-CoA dehydrogenase [Actinomycetia bacterium]|nr:Acyl-CoA dehydrogenase [Actinomycetes bacterium]